MNSFLGKYNLSIPTPKEMCSIRTLPWYSGDTSHPPETRGRAPGTCVVEEGVTGAKTVGRQASPSAWGPSERVGNKINVQKGDKSCIYRNSKLDKGRKYSRVQQQQEAERRRAPDGPAGREGRAGSARGRVLGASASPSAQPWFILMWGGWGGREEGSQDSCQQNRTSEADPVTNRKSVSESLGDDEPFLYRSRDVRAPNLKPSRTLHAFREADIPHHRVPCLLSIKDL